MEHLERRELLAGDLIVPDLGGDRILRFDGATGQEAGVFVEAGAGGLVGPHDPTVSPEGDVLVFHTESGHEKILRFEGDTGEFLETVVDTGSGGFSGGSAMKFGPQGDLYVATNSSQGVLRYDGTNGEYLGAIGPAVGIRRAAGIAFGPDEKLYVLDSDGKRGTFDDRIVRIDTTTGQPEQVVAEGLIDDAADFEFGPDGRLYLPDLTAGSVLVLSSETGELLYPVAADSEGPVFSVTFGPRGNLFASTPGGILKFDPETGERFGEFVSSHTGYVTFSSAPFAEVDLAVTQIAIPPGAVSGNDFAISYTVANLNQQHPAPAGWEDVIYLSTDETLDPGDREIARVRRHAELGPGEQYSETVTASTIVGTGEYSVLVFADRRGTNDERSRVNNIGHSDQSLVVNDPICNVHDAGNAIAVGRTQSDYSTTGGDVQELTLTYTVYNLLPCTASDVVVTTELSDNVTIQQSLPTPHQDGATLVWALGELAPLSSTSIELVLPVDQTTPLQLDHGVRAYARIDSTPVWDDLTAPATLRTDELDAAWFQSTVDADGDDAWIRRTAAHLDQDVNEIFRFVSQDIHYESYTGSLRGSRGTLWSSAGNALDQSSLMIALLRASGVPARYVSGALGHQPSRELILSMFPPSPDTNGHVPADSPVAKPAEEPQLLSEARNHYWVELNTGGELLAADPTIPGAALGETFATAQGDFWEVPDGLRHKVTVSVTRELASPALGIFGGSPLTTQESLRVELNAAELTGRPLSIGHLVTQHTVTNQIARATTNYYQPYLKIGDYTQDPLDGPVELGDTFHEVITSVPLGSQVLTGVFLEVDLVGPDGSHETWNRTILDKIGHDVRKHGGTPHLEFDPDGPTALTNLEVATLNVLPGRFHPGAGISLFQDLHQVAADVLEPNSPQGNYESVRQFLEATNLSHAASFLQQSDEMTASLADIALVRSYFDRPRVIITTSKYDVATGDVSATIDLRRNAVRTLAYPGQAALAANRFNTIRGISENVIESHVIQMPTPGSGINNVTIFAAAREAGIPLEYLDHTNLNRLDDLAISDLAKARITDAIVAGKEAIVPGSMVDLNEQSTIAWYEIEPSTGELVGVLEDGTHGNILLDLAKKFIGAIIPSAGPGMFTNFLPSVPNVGGKVTGWLAGAFLRLSHMVCKFGESIVFHAYNRYTPGLPVESTFCDSTITALGNLTKSAATAVLSFNDPEFRQGFEVALGWWFGKGLKFDPPMPEFLTGADLGRRQTRSVATVPRSIETPLPSGPVVGRLDNNDLALAVNGQMTAEWHSTSKASLQLRELQIVSASIRNENDELVGQGTLEWQSDSPRDVSVRGSVNYELSGSGHLARHPEPEGDHRLTSTWDSFDGTAGGDVAIEMTVGDEAAFFLNGERLAAGEYRVTTESASFRGSGPIAAMNFADVVSVQLSEAAVQFGATSGELSLNDESVDTATGMMLGGVRGNVVFDFVQEESRIDATFQDILRFVPVPEQTTNQNSTLLLPFQLESSHAGSVSVLVEGPVGWDLRLDDDGALRIKPGFVVTPGRYQVRFTAQSEVDPQLVTFATAEIVLEPVAPGLSLEIVHDPIFFVPIAGAQIPTAYEATIHNRGPVAETYQLTFPQVPSGWQVLASSSELTAAPGRSATTGIYLQPVGAIDPPGTQTSLKVVATSESDPELQDIRTITLNVPEVPGVTIVPAPASLAMAPGETLSSTLTVTSDGNAPQVVDFSARTTSGLTVNDLANLSLMPGESKTITLDFAADPGLQLNSQGIVEIIADFGTPDPVEQIIAVSIVAPGVESIARAAESARSMGNNDLADRLDDLARGLTNVVVNPDDPIARAQVGSGLDAVAELLARDQVLRNLVDELSARRDQFLVSVDVSEVLDAVRDLADFLEGFDNDVLNVLEHDFEVFLLPNTQFAQPGQPIEYAVSLHHVGLSDETTYELELHGIPPHVNAELSHTEVVLGSNQFASDLVVTLTQTSAEELSAFDFELHANVQGLPNIHRSTVGAMAARHEFVSLVSVNADPSFVEAGAPVHVWTRVLNSVNRLQDALVSFEVLDAEDQQVFKSQPVAVSLQVHTTISDVYLGAVNTPNLPDGEYQLQGLVTDLDGNPLPGGSGLGRFRIGTPVTATLTVDSPMLPPGDGTVTTTLKLEVTPFFPSPLEVVGHLEVDDGHDIVLRGETAYVCGSEGISVVDLENPSSPVLVGTHGQAASTCTVDDGQLVAVLGPQLPTQLAIYSLDDPHQPELLGETEFDYSRASDVVVSGSRAFVSTNEYCFVKPDIFSPFDIVHQQGDLVTIDLRDDQAPVLLDVLFDTFGTGSDGDPEEEHCAYNGGEHPVFAIEQVDEQTLYVATTSTKGGDPEDGVGRLLIVDIAGDQPEIVGELQVPQTVNVFGIAIDGERALLSGSSGGFRDRFRSTTTEFAVTGEVVLASLDISNAREPQIVHVETVDGSPRGVQGPKAIGNGRFLVPRLQDADEHPQILLVDAGEAGSITVTPSRVPDSVVGFDASDNLVLTVGPAGVLIYEVGAPPIVPASVEVSVPLDTGVGLVEGSFSIQPERETLSEFEVLTFDLQLAASQPQTITWQSRIDHLEGGTSRTIVSAAQVDFRVDGEPGQLELPALEVAGWQLLILTPADLQVRPGRTQNFLAHVFNPGDADAEYDLTVAGLPASWVDFPSSVTVAAGKSKRLTLSITPVAFALDETYDFYVSASGDYSGGAAGRLTVVGEPALPTTDVEAHGVHVELLSDEVLAAQGTPATIVARITNTGSSAEHFQVNVDFPHGQYDVASFIEIPPGRSNYRDLTIEVRPDYDLEPGDYPMRVEVENAGRDSKASDEAGISVVGGSVQVYFQNERTAIVTNTGPASDVFDFTLAGPASNFVTATDQVLTLEPFQSRSVSLDLKDDGLQAGIYELAGVARSRLQPSVLHQGVTNVVVGPRREVQAQFTPATQRMVQPGTASFTLSIDNQGNIWDEYSAQIVQVNGAVRASFVGGAAGAEAEPDSIPAPAFRRKQLELFAEVLQPDVASITVEIQSLIDPSISTTTTAIVSSCPWSNYPNPQDTDNDGHLAPVDALVIINKLNEESGSSRLAPPASIQDVTHFIDVNCDDHLSPLDALLVINQLNNHSEGQGETPMERRWRWAASPQLPLSVQARRSVVRSPLPSVAVDQLIRIPMDSASSVPAAATRPSDEPTMSTSQESADAEFESLLDVIARSSSWTGN